MRNWLKEKRVKSKMTQEDVALKVGVARTTYAAYERGERDPSVGVAMNIAKLLKFKWTLFFEDKVHESCTKKEVG